MARILIAGDICPIGRNRALFEEGDGDSLLNDLRPEFETADLVIANLECPLIDSEAPAGKYGPVLGAPAAAAAGLKAIGVDIAGLANNHIMDHGPGGLNSTIRVLEESGIGHAGAGPDLAAARSILVRETRGVRVGVLAVAEREFGAAGKRRPGYYPLDLIDLVRNIRSRRADLDFLVVLLHGGNQFYPYPRPGLRQICRFLIEEGAGAVICQQSHCPGCREEYRGGLIVYGQGDFLFDETEYLAPWNTGILLRLDLGGGGVRPRLIPFRQPRETGGVRRMSAGREREFFRDFEERSRNILVEGFVESEFEKFCRSQRPYYLNALRGRPSLLRKVAGKLGLLYYLENPEAFRTRLNLVRCESHREALIEILSRGAERGVNREGEIGDE